MTFLTLIKNLFAVFSTTFVTFFEEVRFQIKLYRNKEVEVKKQIFLSKDLIDMATELNPTNFDPKPETFRMYRNNNYDSTNKGD